MLEGLIEYIQTILHLAKAFTRVGRVGVSRGLV